MIAITNASQPTVVPNILKKVKLPLKRRHKPKTLDRSKRPLFLTGTVGIETNPMTNESSNTGIRKRKM